jgi:hypothetical protein
VQQQELIQKADFLLAQIEGNIIPSTSSLVSPVTSLVQWKKKWEHVDQNTVEAILCNLLDVSILEVSDSDVGVFASPFYYDLSEEKKVASLKFHPSFFNTSHNHIIKKDTLKYHFESYKNEIAAYLNEQVTPLNPNSLIINNSRLECVVENETIVFQELNEFNLLHSAGNFGIPLDQLSVTFHHRELENELQQQLKAFYGSRCSLFSISGDLEPSFIYMLEQFVESLGHKPVVKSFSDLGEVKLNVGSKVIVVSRFRNPHSCILELAEIIGKRILVSELYSLYTRIRFAELCQECSVKESSELLPYTNDAGTFTIGLIDDACKKGSGCSECNDGYVGTLVAKGVINSGADFHDCLNEKSEKTTSYKNAITNSGLHVEIERLVKQKNISVTAAISAVTA